MEPDEEERPLTFEQAPCLFFVFCEFLFPLLSGVRPGDHPQPATGHRGLHQRWEPDPGWQRHRRRRTFGQVSTCAIVPPPPLFLVGVISALAFCTSLISRRGVLEEEDEEFCPAVSVSEPSDRFFFFFFYGTQ